MKVTVSFGCVKIVVPCGQGNMLIRDLASMAALRFQKTSLRLPDDSAGEPRPGRETVDFSEGHNDDGIRCEVTSLTLARDGGLLDWDDQVTDVLDDRELLVAHYRIIQTDEPKSPINEALSRCNGEEETQVGLTESLAQPRLPESTSFMDDAAQIPPQPPIRCTKQTASVPREKNNSTARSVKENRHPRPPAPPPPIQSLDKSMFNVKPSITCVPQTIPSDSTMQPCVPLCLTPISLDEITTLSWSTAFNFPSTTLLPVPPYPQFEFNQNEQGCDNSSTSTTSSAQILSTVVEEEDNSSQSRLPAQVGSRGTPTKSTNDTQTIKLVMPKQCDLPATSQRSTRKFKRRRAPRAAPPPPPQNLTIQARQTPQDFQSRHSSSSSPSSGGEDFAFAEKLDTIRRKASVDKPVSTEITSRESQQDPYSISLNTLDEPPSQPLPIASHWLASTDCLPGYSPEELAVAEQTLVQEELSRSATVGHSDLHRLSIDDERLFTMKPPTPPKRSPLTILTGLSMLTPTDQYPKCHDDCKHPSPERGENKLAWNEGTGNSHGDAAGDPGDPYHSNRSSVNDEELAYAWDTDQGEESDRQRQIATAEDEILHMTDLLSKRRESEARRHLMMAELETDIERDHRLQAAATAMALAAASSLSPGGRSQQEQPRKSKCPWHSQTMKDVGRRVHANTLEQTLIPARLNTRELVIKLRKTSQGLGFSLTTKPIIHQERTNSPGSATPLGIYVKSILPEGAALKDGQLRLGDRIIKVDNEDITQCNQHQVVALLRTKPVDSLISLTIQRSVLTPLTSTATSSCPNCSRTCGHEHCFYSTARHACSPKRQGHSKPVIYHNVTLDNRIQGRGARIRCASPVLSRRADEFVEDASEMVLQPANYPSFSDVAVMRFDIPLIAPAHPIDPSHSSDASFGGMLSKHMRLGVSVREAVSSRLSRLQSDSLAFSGHKVDELLWSNPDSVYGGVIVKGVIEGGAAHKDGRLRVGDELLEINSVPLIHANNPLSLLRSVLKQATNQTSVEGVVKAPVVDPVVQLLVARQSRPRRSASGHTLASTSEFMTEGSSTGTALTATTCLTTLLPRRHFNPEASPNISPAVSEGQEESSSTGRAFRIAADVHSMDDFVADLVKATTAGHPPGPIESGVIYSVANSHVSRTANVIGDRSATRDTR